MINLCANTEAEYYALEELHDAMGIITDTPVYFVVKGNQGNISIKQGCKYIYFSDIKPEESFPLNVETYINGSSLYINTDIFGCIVKEFSRSEESNNPKARHGRMPLKESDAYKQGIYRVAYLDRLIGQFKEQFITYLNLQGVSWTQEMPSKKRLICLTHDVDSIKGKSFIRYAFWFTKALLSLKTKEIKQVINLISTYMRLDEDPHFSFQSFYEIEKYYGFCSTFFIMSLPFFLGREGRRYSLRRSDIKEVLWRLSQNGWEIGLHPSRVTCLSKAKLKKEMNRFMSHIGNDNVSMGIRNHYLKASFPETWRIQEELGIQYDSSLGWYDSPGFRAGTSRPFRPFDAELNRRLNVWEIPLIVMDGSLQGSSDTIVAKCKMMAEEAFQYNTPFTILWHSDRLSEIEYSEFSDAYLKLLKYFKEMDCIGTTATNIVRSYQIYSQEMSQHRKRIQ